MMGNEGKKVDVWSIVDYIHAFLGLGLALTIISTICVLIRFILLGWNL